MKRMFVRRKGLAATAACLVLGLGAAAGVAGSTGEPTNEDLARQGQLERPAARGGESPSNEQLLAEDGLKSPGPVARSSGGPSND